MKDNNIDLLEEERNERKRNRYRSIIAIVLSLISLTIAVVL